MPDGSQTTKLRWRLAESDYYGPPPTRHVAQGDVFSEVPFALGDVKRRKFKGAGKRQRPLFGPHKSQTEPLAYLNYTGLGVVCSYTCGFMAQPVGTEGYGHPYRLMAPIISIEDLAAEGVPRSEPQNLKGSGGSDGYMYVPPPLTGEPAIICLYRMTLVHQDALDELDRVTSMSEAAQRILIARCTQIVSPYRPA